MSTGLFNKDSSFFEIVDSDITVPEKDFSDNVLSLTLTEEMGKMNSGSMRIYDPEHFYSKILRMGVKLTLSWGYKRFDSALESVFSLISPSEVTGPINRGKLNAVVMSPSGSLGQDGTVIYNCNFYAREFLLGGTKNVYSTGTKKTVVETVFLRMGFTVSFVKFDRMTEVITPDTQVIQYENDYKFVLRLAQEWQCIFRTGNDVLGNFIALFINPKYVDDTLFLNLVTGAFKGGSINLDYKDGARNVIEASWKNHAGESGSGDSVQLTYMNGKPTFIRYIAQSETVKAWRFVPERVEKKLRGAPDFKSRALLVKEYLNASDFEQVKWAFEPIESSTAPQGLGYSVNAKVLGNPLITAPMSVTFGKGFPDFLSHRLLNYYLRKVEHTIDRSGYFCNLDIVDILTLTGGSFI
jgi:hypothetical protein